MNANETGTVEYSTELVFNSNLPNLIVLNVVFYTHLIRQFDSAHVKCDVETRPKRNDYFTESYHENILRKYCWFTQFSLYKKY